MHIIKEEGCNERRLPLFVRLSKRLRSHRDENSFFIFCIIKNHPLLVDNSYDSSYLLHSWFSLPLSLCPLAKVMSPLSNPERTPMTNNVISAIEVSFRPEFLAFHCPTTLKFYIMSGLFNVAKFSQCDQ